MLLSTLCLILHMKKALLFVLLAFALDVSGQNQRTAFIPRRSASCSPEKLRGMFNSMNGLNTRLCGMDLGKTGLLRMAGSRSLKQVYDSIYEWQWDTLSAGWLFSYKYTSLVYDEHSNLTSFILLQKSGSVWPNSRKYTYTYDANGNQTSTLTQIWTGTAWENFALGINTWDANNNRTSTLFQQWIGAIWVKVGQYLFTYNAANNITNELAQDWDGNFWVNAFQNLYTYDEQNNVTSTNGQYWVSTAWVNYALFNYTYDANNRRTNFLYKTWAGSEWVNLYQEVYTYDAHNNLTGYMGQEWDGASWYDYFKAVYTYDSNNNETSFLEQSLYGIDWVNYTQELFAYDAGNFSKAASYKNWKEDGTKIKDGDSTYNYFHTAEGIIEPTAQKPGTLIFPNPCNGKLTISSTTPLTAVEIYNVAGVLVFSDNKTDQPGLNKLDLSALPRGIYMMKIYARDGTHMEKVVIQ